MKNAAISYREFLQYQQNNPSLTGYEYSAFALRALGGALQKSGQDSDALKAYDDYLRKYPRSVDAINVAMDRLAVIYGAADKIPTDKLKEICSAYPIDSGYGEQFLYQMGLNYFINGQYRPAVKPLHKAWHITLNIKDMSYSAVLAEQAALLEMRCLNLAGMVFERDSVANETANRFKGTLAALETSESLNAYHADTNTNSGAASNSISRVAVVLAILVIGVRLAVIRIRRERR